MEAILDKLRKVNPGQLGRRCLGNKIGQVVVKEVTRETSEDREFQINVPFWFRKAWKCGTWYSINSINQVLNAPLISEVKKESKKLLKQGLSTIQVFWSGVEVVENTLRKERRKQQSRETVTLLYPALSLPNDCYSEFPTMPIHHWS